MRLLITADSTYTAWIDGASQPAASGHDWSLVNRYDITASVRPGDNLLCVEATSGRTQGGLIFAITGSIHGSRVTLAASGDTVRASRRVPAIWRAVQTDDSQWPVAAVVAPAGGGPWKTLQAAPATDYTHLAPVWDIRNGDKPGVDPYSADRTDGQRMLLSASVAPVPEMQLLAAVGFTLFQSDSDHLSTEETSPGHWDWQRQLAESRAAHGLGLDWAYFEHEAFPPPWARNAPGFVPISCLEHNQPVEAWSPWAPAWADFIDRGYTALGAAFTGPTAPATSRKPTLNALCVGIHGDYGEAGFFTGARVSVPIQRDDWLKRFGNLHDHLGWWCNDPDARADFQKSMIAKYAGIKSLDAAWKRDWTAPAQIAYPVGEKAVTNREWLDFTGWYSEAIIHAIDLNVAAARRAFPHTLLMVPAGLADENPRGGADLSQIVKEASTLGVTVRSTHGGFRPFAENASTMFGRLGSACRFYGVPFWSEPPGIISPRHEVARIFEALSQGCTGYFDWSSNAVAASEVYYRYGSLLTIDKPVVDVAMFYPAEAQRTRPDEGYAPLFARACAFLRDAANFDLVDDRMVDDGCLSKYRILVLWQGTRCGDATLLRIRDWVNQGGVLMAYDFGKIEDFDGSTKWFHDLFGYVQQLAPAHVTDVYSGAVPDQYRIAVADGAMSPYLSGNWMAPETVEGMSRRWISSGATVRVPVVPEQKYIIAIRAWVPPSAATLKRQLLINGRIIGDLEATGDVTYRFLVSSDALVDHPLTDVTFRCETFARPGGMPGAPAENVSMAIAWVQMIRFGTAETVDSGPPPGSIVRELDMQRLATDWAQRYGKGLTIYFPANRDNIDGFIEVVRHVIYHLSALLPGSRDALPFDTGYDGVYATLFPDRVLFYNSTAEPVSRTVTVPRALFAQWRGVVQTPDTDSWKLDIAPYGLAAIYFSPTPVQLLFECEQFLHLGHARASANPLCSPGTGATCVRLKPGDAISTSVSVDQAGLYRVFTRCIRNGQPVAVDVSIDGSPLQPLNRLAGATMLSGMLKLTRGPHTITVRPYAGKQVLADFVALSDDANVAGYAFALRTPPLD
ncbi:MAG: hypothetical protein KGJ62_07090 [Armatimonadetes bacterium]|nr:hypothetical protein [Armatimonadota bacterium]MDE2207301.1 hypothetical protein [Armatimonadota bacterium]